MVRTMAGGQRKAVAAKAPRKTVGCSSSSSSSSSASSSRAAVSSVFSPGRAGKSKSRCSAGGNAPTYWDTPKWQKGIACFFKKAEVGTDVTKHAAADSSTGDTEQMPSSQGSSHTIDLNETSPGGELSMFDPEEEAGPSSSTTSCSDDGEQPGPSSRIY